MELVFLKITQRIADYSFADELKSRGHDVVQGEDQFTLYIKCPTRKRFEIESLKTYHPNVKSIETVKTSTNYLLYAGGATEQKKSNPYLFAFMPIALVKTYNYKPDHKTISEDLKHINMDPEGYMLIKQTVPAEQEFVALNKETIIVSMNFQSN